ncbi:hypothetical protein L226DRAFT_112329 [Lentinus tigrinus ALCF2SS1-7]|uniref:Uncharacterized protein n=1 Tax=Lentinus tigrinus ALCF2SS1-6 TaxID=1328759 RepID=A0A5C2S1H0_9APHY|nr:hypothetical protein L227DRAFT_234334 [Lentinus tigrinus ALCF2SS1-6]RPD73116.1 hypothetical protein L226DRAFT_112329 [Lentinus tigrinus ALCF2SS1-7]
MKLTGDAVEREPIKYKAFERVVAMELDEGCTYETMGRSSLRRVSSGRPDAYVRRTVSQLHTAYHMTYQKYCAFPSYSRAHRATCSRFGVLESWWVFLLRDNSSKKAIHALVEPEDAQAMKEFLGVKPQDVKCQRALNVNV